MRGQDGRGNLIVGSAVVTTALVLADVVGRSAMLFLPLVVCGLVLALEGGWSTHTFEAAARLERWYAAEAKAPKRVTTAAVVQPGVPRNVRALVWDWAQERPTTRRYAEQVHGVSQEQWERTVAWAVRNGLGELVPGEGGNRKLRWTASSINEALTVLDGLGGMA